MLSLGMATTRHSEEVGVTFGVDQGLKEAVWLAAEKAYTVLEEAVLAQAKHNSCTLLLR